MVTPSFDFFFSRWILSTQPVNGTHTVELTDTHREAEALSHQALDLAAGGRAHGMRNELTRRKMLAEEAKKGL
jgi:hypothetical protein